MKRASVVARWVGALAVAAIAGSCGQTGTPGDTTTVRSAVNSNVLVTVRDGAGALQPSVEVFAVKTNGSIQASGFTNGSGVATLSLPASSYRFRVTEAGSDFFSGAAGHCTTPSCTTAQITVTRVNVTVVLTDGTPLVNRSVWWETPGGQTGGYVYSDANGHSLVAVPAGSYAFFNEVNGWEFPSGSAGHCVVPTCTTATIVETLPVAVTVRNTSGVPQANVTVAWEDANGAMGGWEATDANGVVMLSVPQGAITFKVDPDNDVEFTSTPVCNVPGCTSASVVISSPVTVTVTDTGGAPITGKQVFWENAAGTAGSGTNTNASGVATLTPPNEPVRFKITVDGTTFYSATTTNCVQPGCTTATILVSQASVVTLVDGSGNPISGRAVTPTSTEGITSGNKTTNASGQATFRLPFAHWQFKAKCSGNNETFFSGNAGHCFIPGGCLTAKIKMPCGQCTTAANGTACDDQSPCTGSSTCQSHFCTGANPTSCSASDQCHDAGACGVETGACSNPAKANGTSCSDGNSCTQTDTCQSGTCTGSNPVTCTALDLCHDVGTCAPLSGQCSNPPKPAGTSCGGSGTCTAGGECVSNNQAPVVNAGTDQSAGLHQPKPSPTFTIQPISTQFNNAVGIEYHPVLNKMVVSVNCCGGTPHNFEAINADGTHNAFTTTSGLTDEVYFAIARDDGGGHSIGGFTTGQMFFATGTPGVIARVSSDGSTINKPWVTLPGETGLLRGMLQFDRTGVFGGDLLVTTTAGHLWRVTAAGSATQVATGIPGGELEGLTAVPNDPGRYGPWAGKILIGDEDIEAVYAVDATGTVATYHLGVSPEDIMIVPPGENFYGVDYGAGVVYGASASQFRDKVGDVLIAEEFNGHLWQVVWNGSSFQKTLLAQVGVWEHTTFGPAPMAEVEQSNVQVALSGTASDDGHPTSGTLVVTWSLVSGPGPVTFADSHALATSATFIEEGTYVLALTASDGELSTSDRMTVTVRRISPQNTAPVVDAGPDQTVQLPHSVDLAGSATDDGIPSGSAIAFSWAMVSGPSEAIFLNPTVGLGAVLFIQPGTYVLRLTASDGELSASDDVTITVNSEPSLDGGNLDLVVANALSQIGSLNQATATLTNASSQPLSRFPVQLTITGANPLVQTLDTDDNGVVSFVWRGVNTGTDTMHATALGVGTTFDSATVQATWTDVPIGGPVLTQGWIASPVTQTRVMSQVPIVLADDVTLTSGTILYWPAARPSELHTLATGVSGAPSAQIGTLDTTTLANDVYVIHLEGTSSEGEQKASEVVVTVSGDYKPGRVVIETTDYQVPIAGIPITIGRRYDSLEKDKVGDFGHGWSLMIGHPRVEQAPNYSVTLTLPNGRRATFDLQAAMSPAQIVAGGLNPFPGVFFTSYVAEPGEYGTLTQDGGCPAVRLTGDPTNPIKCFFTFGFVPGDHYAPEVFTYTDPYGTAYRMTAAGELQTIKDRQGNTLTFTPNGITSNTGKNVTFQRDSEGRITLIDQPAQSSEHAVSYEYDGNGDLVTAQLEKVPFVFFRFWHYTYYEGGQHQLKTSTDPNGNPARTLAYYADGRLKSDSDAATPPHVTMYEYDLDGGTTTTYPDQGELQQTFDERGLVISETDQRGHTTTHEYDSNKNEVSRTNALGEVTTAIYDSHGNQTSVTDPTGTTYATYGDDNLPTSFTDRMEHVSTIEYDPDLHVPTRLADEIGTRFRFKNNEHGLPLSVEDAAGRLAHLEYDAAGNVTKRRDWIGRTSYATYDEAGHKLTETSAGGATTNYVYFSPGWLASTRDTNNFIAQNSYDQDGNLLVQSDSPSVRGETRYVYNAVNQLVQVTHVSEGATVTYERDFRGNPTSMTDENNHTTTYEYDRKGNLMKTTFPDDDANPANNPFTTRTYDALDRLASVTDENGHTTTYEYEPGCGCSDRVTTVTDPLGNATVTVYDPNGRRSSVTDANHHKTTFGYDVRGHLTDTHYPDSTSTHEEYDSRGRRVSMTDQTHVTSVYGYDDQGQLTSVTDPLSNITRYTYDADGNLTSVTDANSHTTTYEYDLLRRKTKRTLPLAQFETFGYDFAGRQTSHTDFRGKTTTMTYDSRDRMLTKVPDASLGEAAHVYTYFPNGLRHTATNAVGTTTYDYDFRDRLKTKTSAAGTLTYTYDPAGNVATIRSGNTNGTSVDYGWNANNQLLTVTDNRVGGTTTAAYTPTKRPSTLSQPNGIGLTYSYDALDRVTSMLWKLGTSPAFGSWAYTRNERGQRLSSTDITGRSAAYAYDAASRLESETITADPRGASFNGALMYALDDVGNRLSRTSTLAALGAQSLTYNANDEVSADTYDANGNTLTSDGHTYAYDFENHLVSKDAGAVTLAYNCDGNRVEKTIGGVTTRYLVDDLNPTGYLQVLEEVVGGAVQTRYSYGTRIVSQTRNVPTTPATSYYGFDGHGDITFLTDSAGAVTDSYDYDAWGILVANSGATPNKRLYVGEELDPDLGLINLRARQYKPATGRFLTLDPLPSPSVMSRSIPGLESGLSPAPHLGAVLGVLALDRYLAGGDRLARPKSLHKYNYVSVDPLNLFDPLGLMEFTEEEVLDADLYNEEELVLRRLGTRAKCFIDYEKDAFVILDMALYMPAEATRLLAIAYVKFLACLARPMD